jgi:isocitrate dehydrogenase
MKMTDGLFHKVFDEISVDYADIDKEHMIVDIGMAKIADYPELFDVVVVPNLYGDILSDIVAEMSGSVGMVGSSNVGENHAMFEAIHGSAPDIAGKKVANPSGLLRGAIMMLAHIGQTDVAENVYNAWLKTIEEGIHTPDIFNPNRSVIRVNTDEFTDAVIGHLGQEPEDLKAKHYSHEKQNLIPYVRTREDKQKDLVGIDVFVHEKGEDAEALAAKMKAASGPLAKLTMISNRGVKVWPEGFPETFFTDHWRCRFKTVEAGGVLSHKDIAGLLSRLADEGVDFIKTEHLYNFDGEPGYSLGHGE